MLLTLASAFLVGASSSSSSSPSPHSHAEGAAAPRLTMLRESRSSSRLLSPSALLCAVLLLVGTAGYKALEGWPLLDCAYAAVGVLTTMGIVVNPRTHSSRLFTAVLNMLSLGVMSVFLGEVSDARRAYARRALRLSGGGGGGGAPSPLAEAAAYGAAAVVPLAAATAFFSVVEGWSVREAAFVAFASATGLGLADAAPATDAGKVAMSLYLVANMGVTLTFMSVVGHVLVGAASGPAARLEAVLCCARAGGDKGARGGADAEANED